MKILLTAASAAVLLATALPANAAEPELDTRTAKVSYSDLDLANPRGVSTLQNRVSGAISQVCSGPNVGLQASLDQRACETKAMASAGQRAASQ